MFDFLTVGKAESFGFSAENPTGVRGGGTGKDCDKPSAWLKVAYGETITLVEVDGPGRIEHIWMTGDLTHHFILRIYWDGQDHPSVETPVSAFFGWAYDQNFKTADGQYPTLNSVMMLLSPGMSGNCYWPMPFHKHCRITLENRGLEPQCVYYMIVGHRGAQPADAGYFHASYRQQHPVTAGKAYTVIDGIQGAGQFVGVTLAAGLNGPNTCWVEGEARMYLDGEKTPSLHYTGTEDYFCGSFAFGNDNCLHHYQTYSGAYVGMFAVCGDTREMYKGQQRFLLYRWHVADPIRFSTGFRMTLDNLGWSGPRYDDYTSVAYWYQTLPSIPLVPLPSDQQLDMT
jgi:hypothetical protein